MLELFRDSLGRFQPHSVIQQRARKPQIRSAQIFGDDEFIRWPNMQFAWRRIGSVPRTRRSSLRRYLGKTSHEHD